MIAGAWVGCMASGLTLAYIGGPYLLQGERNTPTGLFGFLILASVAISIKVASDWYLNAPPENSTQTQHHGPEWGHGPWRGYRHPDGSGDEY
jgi:hypothetical protein